ncbi:MAG: class I SAM-dependent methyltransferase [Candidatus Acidiferrales bacterium]
MVDQTAQARIEGATAYEQHFVPALFADWAPRVADAAKLQSGNRVLDVACGTGVLAREAAKRVVPDGSVVGLDVDDAMVTVAARVAPQIEWRQAPAEAIPYPSDSFDAVVSQFGLMFFSDQRAAVNEMVRVLRASGGLCVAVWNSLDAAPGFAALVNLLQHRFGTAVADVLRAPFSLGERAKLSALFAQPGLSPVEISTQQGAARFHTIRAWMETEVRGWLACAGHPLSDAQIGLLVQDAEKAFPSFVTAKNTVEVPISAHIICAIKNGPR